jgi:hypothetical protein
MLPQVDCAPNICEGRTSIVDVEDDGNIVTVAFNKARRFIENDANEARRGRARFAPNQCKYGPAHHTLAPVVSMKKSRRLQVRFARLLTSQSASPSLCAAAIDVLLAGGVRSNPFPFSAAP